MQVELDLTFLLNFSKKLFFDKNDVETHFFLKTGFKIGVRIIHGCALYTGKYGMAKQTVIFLFGVVSKYSYGKISKVLCILVGLRFLNL